MSIENGNFFQGTIEEIDAEFGVSVEVVGIPPVFDEMGEYLFGLAVNELLVNCCHNRVSGSDEGASRVLIDIAEDEIRIIDDYEYTDQRILEERINMLQDRVRNPQPGTTKDDGKGGKGVLWSANILKGLGMNLDYYVEGNRIVALIS